MKYISYLNQLFREEISKLDAFVLYGQNVSTGSCLGGLTRDLDKIKGCNVFNTPNTENTLVGMGFGLLLSGTSSAFFMKQQDFLLLGVDHLRNTYNFVRQQMPSASFTIVNVTMDAGYEGIQSSLNNLSDFCAIASCEGYTISSKQEAVSIIKQVFIKPGFRIISASQRLFGTEILEFQGQTIEGNELITKYRQGSDVTIACFNFSLPQGEKLHNELNRLGISGSLYSISAAHPANPKVIIEDAEKTGRLVIIDDSKCCISVSSQLEIEALKTRMLAIYVIKREVTERSYQPLPEIFNVDVNNVVQKLNLQI
ncbi:AcoB Pyruvate/2-oxoglutarate dehydrogenase complex, dehydrogenase (E1) component, eukaryotic type, beta subunit [Candidatus Methylopumilus universalis]|uniref:hypothetical protein n=1 Tax=Candidatus Methylopumilus universalis TaxID=2588536 RepID=UPI003BEF3A00